MASTLSTRPAVRLLRSALGSEVLKVFVILSLALLVFFAKPLFSGQSYAAGDVSGLSKMLRPADGHVGRIRQIDITVDFLPWADFNRTEVREGRLPLWNQYNNSGVPHLGNLQSAVFSPFTVPFYVMSMRWALLVSAYLILMTAGMLMFGLMRHLRLSGFAALGASFAYMFSAYNVLWLRWPLASVAAFLPGIFWASSALVRATGWRRTTAWGVALATLIALGVVAGHPETLMFGVFPTAAWCLVWLAKSGLPLREATGRFLRLIAAGVVGLALSAIQLLPFLEYVARSPASSDRGTQVFESASWAAVHVFPRFAGSPAMKFPGPFGLALPYHEVTGIYVGSFALLLAIIAVISTRWTHRRGPWIFAVMCIVWVLYGYDVLGMGRLISHLPAFSLVMASRSAIAWAFCISVLVGFGIDGVRALGVQDRIHRWRAPTVLAGAAVGAFGLVALWTWERFHASVSPLPNHRALAQATARHHVIFIGSWFLLGVLLLVLLLLVRGRRPRQILCGGVAIVIFMQSGYLLRGENTSVSAERFMRFPSAARHVAAEVGDDQTLWVDGAYLMPDLNLWYRVRSPGNYDAISLQTYDTLYRAILRPPRVSLVGGAQLGILGGPVDPVGTRGLAVLGIRRVVTSKSYPMATGVFLGIEDERATHESGQVFHFKWEKSPPDELVAYTDGIPPGTPMEVQIDVSDGRDLPPVRATTQGHLVVAPLPSNLPERGGATVTIRPVSGSKQARSAGRISAAKSVHSPIPGLHLDKSVGGYQVYTVVEAAGLASSPASATWVETNAEALEKVEAADFAPKEQVVLEGVPAHRAVGRAPARQGTVTVSREAPGDLTLHVTRSSPGYVVVNENAYPGWQAMVDGRRQPIYRANSTYMAIPVEAGTSTVRLQFRPASIRLGAAISAFVLVALLGGLAAAAWWPRQRSERVGMEDDV